MTRPPQGPAGPARLSEAAQGPRLGYNVGSVTHCVTLCSDAEEHRRFWFGLVHKKYQRHIEFKEALTQKDNKYFLFFYLVCGM